MPGAACSSPMRTGPTPRTSRAMTGTMCMYGNISRFARTVISTIALKVL